MSVGLENSHIDWKLLVLYTGACLRAPGIFSCPPTLSKSWQWPPQIHPCLRGGYARDAHQGRIHPRQVAALTEAAKKWGARN